MLITTKPPMASSEITDPRLFHGRRLFIKALLGMAAGAAAMPATADHGHPPGPALVPTPDGLLQVSGGRASCPPAALIPTPDGLLQAHTNYYEFSAEKTGASALAQRLTTDPWSVTIGGEVENPGAWHLEDLLKKQRIGEYVYRFRCVEGWSMVVPWLGFPLADLLKQARPLANAKFVKFTSVYQPEAMPNQRHGRLLHWPYVEGLRIDEAMHPLTILAVGAYGRPLAKQNGAPLRLVVPWKYGFKSIKAIVDITLQARPPLTSWHRRAPNEYGFYANVNPQAPHPRWSQRSERLLGSRLFTPRRPTEPFNGYGGQVASLYGGMDLRRFF